MPALISIVIPTLNAAEALPETVDALLPGIGDGLVRELVISDGESEDNVAEIAKDLGAEFVKTAPGRGGQIARGIAAAKADWLLILHADTHLSPDWPRAVRYHIAAAPDAAGWFSLRFRATGIWPQVVAAGANLRSRWFSLPYGDQGLLISRTLLAEIGGVPDLPLMEDVALARRLRGRLRALDATAHTSAERYITEGWARRAGRNLLTLARYLGGADAADLARSYAASKTR